MPQVGGGCGGLEDYAGWGGVFPRVGVGDWLVGGVARFGVAFFRGLKRGDGCFEVVRGF